MTKIGDEHRSRRAVVYVRQSTPSQVSGNLESQRRQYGLAERAKELGFREVSVIDDDLGRSGSGLSERPGFQKLVAEVCAGGVGAVMCIEASRLARNGRDWHHLIDFCGLVGTVIVDPEGVYDPRSPNDRLLLGLKGSMNEFEVSLFRQRSFEAIRNKARRGELHFRLPVGLRWNDGGAIELDPNQRVQEAIRLAFRRLVALGSLRQVLLWMRAERLSMPALNIDGTTSWKQPVYSSLHHMVTNPFYAGAYAYGRTGDRTRVVGDRARKTRGHAKSIADWAVLIRDHHPGYISWEQFERNKTMLTENANMKQRMARGSGRGGRGLLGALLRCRRCGRMLQVHYTGPRSSVVRYACSGAQLNHGEARCISFGGLGADEAIARVVVDALAPHAIDAAIEAHGRATREGTDQHRALSLELEQSRYDARLAARRYEAVDSDNRLVAAELEARWNAALVRVRELESNLEALSKPESTVAAVDRAMLLALADALPSVWNSPSADMRLKQRIVRILVQEIIADVDSERGEIVLTVHWSGGRHTELRVRKRRTGEHGRGTSEDASEVVKRMAGRWPDDQIAATLNRLGLRTGADNTWNEHRVYSLRHRLQLPAFDREASAQRPRMLTLGEAARALNVHESLVRRMIRDGIVAASQAVARAPFEIAPEALTTQAVSRAVEHAKSTGQRQRARAADRTTLPLPLGRR
jgi:DNA invertase Pin-like site-specific DNA recombinase